MTNPNLAPEDQRDFAASVMSKIEKDQITTYSRAWFWVHDFGFWSLWFISALIGAFALSATLFVLQSSTWRLYLVTHESLLDYVTDVMPYVWLCLFGLMCVLAYINLRHTPRGYRHSTVWLIGLNLTVTIFLGAILTAAGMGEFVDEQIGRHIPLYSSISHKQESEWFKPAEGLLIGRVIHVEQSLQLFVLESPEQTALDIDGHLLSDEEWQLLEVPSVMVRVIGVPKETTHFMACIVLPVLPPGIIPMRLDYPERNPSEQRSSECRGVRPYDRFDQIKHW
jgi:hypothetical protein